jgi:hypothetical protein
LQRQFAYDRLLERLYLMDRDWIVKGATALLARDLGVRGTIDIDLYRVQARDTVEADLREAALRDVSDWFRFEIGPSHPVAGGAAGVRVPAVAYVGESVWVQFHVDLVSTDIRMTGEPDDVPPIANIDMPHIHQHGYRAYPLVDHIADKIVAIYERHGEGGNPSTRFKDLVDVVAIVRGASVPAAAQRLALASEADRRGITLPDRLEIPDLALWEAGYAAEANRAVLPIAGTLDEAMDTVRPFVDALLDDSAAGYWDPVRRVWAP